MTFLSIRIRTMKEHVRTTIIEMSSIMSIACCKVSNDVKLAHQEVISYSCCVPTSNILYKLSDSKIFLVGRI